MPCCQAEGWPPGARRSVCALTRYLQSQPPGWGAGAPGSPEPGEPRPRYPCGVWGFVPRGPGEKATRDVRDMQGGEVDDVQVGVLRCGGPDDGERTGRRLRQRRKGR